MRWVLRDQEPLWCVCSCSLIDFVVDGTDAFDFDFDFDFDGDFEGDFVVEEREDDVLLSLISGSVFFLGEDLVKRPISVVNGAGAG